jgi:hypothetical protein
MCLILSKGDHIAIFDRKTRTLITYGVFFRYTKEGDLKTIVSYAPGKTTNWGKIFDKDLGYIIIENLSYVRLINIILKHYRHEL